MLMKLSDLIKKHNDIQHASLTKKRPVFFFVEDIENLRNGTKLTKQLPLYALKEVEYAKDHEEDIDGGRFDHEEFYATLVNMSSFFEVEIGSSYNLANAEIVLIPILN